MGSFRCRCRCTFGRMSPMEKVEFPVPPYAGESVEVAETTPLSAWRGPVSEPMAKVVVVALVVVAFTMTRLVMVEVALLTRMGTEGVAERTPSRRSQACPKEEPPPLPEIHRKST